jgi:hypothetical protein
MLFRTIKNEVRAMSLNIYPAGDRYFCEGLTHIFPREVSDGGVLILNLTKWSLREIVLSNWTEIRRMQPTVIITEDSLLPVADYLRYAYGNVGVITSSQLILPE